MRTLSRGMLLDSFERALVDRAAAWPQFRSLGDIGRAQLAEVCRLQGIDFATALLYDRIRSSARHGPFIRRLESSPDPRSGGPARPDLVVGVVPGAFYLENPITGADGGFVREAASQLGCPSEVVPLRSFGSVPDNARAVCAWLLQRPATESIVLVSLSKGSAEVKLALKRPEAPAAFRRVVLWLNVSGILLGSPAVRWLLRRRMRFYLVSLLLRLRGHRPDVIRELDYGPGTLLDDDLRVQDWLTVIHVAGFPLERHLSSRLARRGFRRLAPLGPNDGAGIVLADLCRLPGLIYPVWGADHYLRPEWDIAGLFARLVACRDLAGIRHEASVAFARR